MAPTEATRKVGKHPVRDLTREVFAGEKLDVTKLQEHVDKIDLPANVGMGERADMFISSVAGAVEGKVIKMTRPKNNVGPTPGKLDKAQRPKAKGAETVEEAPKRPSKTTQYLALIGLKAPPNEAQLNADIDLVVARAKVNKANVAEGTAGVRDFPKLDEFAEIGSALLGLNTGPDQITQVRVVDFVPKGRKNRDVQLHAFDGAGNHVLEAKFIKNGPGSLYIDSLKATHGRSVDDMDLGVQAKKQPGLGNALLTATGLETIIREGVKHGLHSITTQPGSPMVAQYYQKMGFTAPASSEPFRPRPVRWLLEMIPWVRDWLNLRSMATKQENAAEAIENGEPLPYLMTLDLTNPVAVKQALMAFGLSRSGVTDVPKGIPEKLKAEGEAPPKSMLPTYQRRLPESWSNVRVMRLGEE